MMNKIEVSTCGKCPFCVIPDGKDDVICYAKLKLDLGECQLDKELIEDDRLVDCPLNEGILVIAKEDLEDEIEEESTEE